MQLAPALYESRTQISSAPSSILNPHVREPEKASRNRRLRNPRSRPRSPRLRHGQVLSLLAHHEGVARRDQLPASRAVPQHLLLPVRSSLHRRPRAHPLRDRAPELARRHRAGRRTALGRTGALHPLPELPHLRLVHTRTSASKHQPSPPRSRPCSPPTTASAPECSKPSSPPFRAPKR